MQVYLNIVIQPFEQICIRKKKKKKIQTFEPKEVLADCTKDSLSFKSTFVDISCNTLTAASEQKPNESDIIVG